jgi:membrane protein involved in colicin uptake
MAVDSYNYSLITNQSLQQQLKEAEKVHKERELKLQEYEQERIQLLDLVRQEEEERAAQQKEALTKQCELFQMVSHQL